jgi:iron complex transport system ATP-binding protein
MIFQLDHMSCGYHDHPVLSDISFSVETGQMLSILGPNGVGKTTLFKSMLGLLKPMAGRVLIDGEDIAGWSNRKKAQYIGYIPQSHVPPFPYSVMQVVVMGSVAHLGQFESPRPEDYEFAQRVLEELGIAHLADRVYTEISGGERQMVLIARALTQRPQILLMDEPTANLDYGNQARSLGLINRLAASGMIVVMTTHSPDHCFLCNTQVLLIERESRVTFGSADEVVTEENLQRAYDINVCILQGSHHGQSVKGCIPILEPAGSLAEEVAPAAGSKAASSKDG